MSAHDLAEKFGRIAAEYDEEAIAHQRDGRDDLADQALAIAADYRENAALLELGLRADDHSASRRVDVLEREAPHLLARPRMLEADDRRAW